jgi:hypothetical protein
MIIMHFGSISIKQALPHLLRICRGHAMSAQVSMMFILIYCIELSDFGFAIGLKHILYTISRPGGTPGWLWNLRPESTGPLLITPRSSADPTDEKPATGGGRRCTDSNPRQPATPAEPSRAIPAPSASGPRQPPGRTRIPAAIRHTRPGRERTPSPSRDPSTRLAARRRAQVNTARPPPGPGGHAYRGSTPGAQGRGLTPQPRGPRWPLHADTEPGRPGPRQTGPVPRGIDTQINSPLQILSRPRPATARPGGPRAARTLTRAGQPARRTRPCNRGSDPKWVTVSDSFHRCRSSADPGPPLPGPADYALQGLSFGPATRPYAGSR